MALMPFLTKLRAGTPAMSAATGPTGESIAARHLIDKGYYVLKRNFRTRHGELDLICEAPDKQTIVFVEVKTAAQTTDAAFAPERRVGPKKQRKIAGLAAAYLRKNRLTSRPVRFDVLGVNLVGTNNTPDIRHHPAAFSSPW